MALTLKNFVGFETGGLEEANAVNGAPTVNSSVVRTGNYSLKLTGGAAAYYEVYPYQNNLQGFAVYFTDVTPASDWDFITWDSASTLQALRLEQATGDLILVGDDGAEVDEIAAPFNINTWYYIEVYSVLHGSVGSMNVYINGVSQLTVSGDQDTTWAFLRWHASGTATEDLYVDDYYNFQDASSVNDFLGPRTEVLGAFQNTVEDATDQGDTLDVGSWSDAGDTPGADEGTFAEYNSNPQAGHTRCDEGSRAGPAELITGTVKGGKWIFRLEMGGTKTPVYHRLGKFVLGGSDSTQDISFTPIRNDANYFYVEENMTYVPNADDEVFCQGGNIDSGNDMGFLEMWSFLLHVAPDPATLDLSDMEFPDQNYYLGPFGT